MLLLELETSWVRVVASIIDASSWIACLANIQSRCICRLSVYPPFLPFVRWVLWGIQSLPLRCIGKAPNPKYTWSTTSNTYPKQLTPLLPICYLHRKIHALVHLECVLWHNIPILVLSMLLKLLKEKLLFWSSCLPCFIWHNTNVWSHIYEN